MATYSLNSTQAVDTFLNVNNTAPGTYFYDIPASTFFSGTVFGAIGDTVTLSSGVNTFFSFVLTSTVRRLDFQFLVGCRITIVSVNGFFCITGAVIKNTP